VIFFWVHRLGGRDFQTLRSYRRADTSTTVHAGAAPKDLYGKSVVVIWSADLEGTSSHNERSSGFYVVLTTNVCTAGQLFTQVWQGGGVGPHRQENAVTYESPGDRSAHGDADFQNRSLVITSSLKVGARRIVVEFDPAFSTCERKVTHCRELEKTRCVTPVKEVDRRASFNHRV
jgi:hypothetical protein